MSKPKIIAFYLPQYHPTPDNDKWWGKGFTEWTNVGKAKPLYKGHDQPKVPADLGYYDLRLPEVREAQAELAKEAGIYGFCYWNYWFGNGKEELELPLNEVLRLGKPDFPFMICWCNESWYRKMWDKDINGNVKELILEQKYPGEEDIVNHFYSRLKYFKDPRYIKYENKPVFMVYRWMDVPDIKRFINIWDHLSKKEGFDGIYFVAYLVEDISYKDKLKILELGFNGINVNRFYTAINSSFSKFVVYKDKILKRLFKVITIYDYKKIYQNLWNEDCLNDHIFPTLVPNWDPSPRRGRNAILFKNCTPVIFRKYCVKLFEFIKNKNNPNYIFLRAWNEWGEGNYMEPDLKYGKGFIKALKDALNTVFK